MNKAVPTHGYPRRYRWYLQGGIVGPVRQIKFRT
jgi:hypothetical protein